jgi:replicative DNA helicase
VTSSAHIEYHCRILIQKFILRSLIENAYEVIDKAYKENTDVFDLLNQSERKLFEMGDYHLKKKVQKVDLLASELLKEMYNTQQKGDLSGMSSGFKKLDELSGGFQPSDLIILAARPGMGKTAFVLSLARFITLEKKIPVAFFSLEMSSRQLMMRLMALESSIDCQKLKKASLSRQEWALLHEKIATIEQAPLFIDDSPSLSLFDLRAKARKLVLKEGVELLIVDYLQLMSTNNSERVKIQNREQEISTISRGLKALVKELNVPILALSQLSRAVETRADKRPMLSDLRESGATQQDADLVGFIYRPEYYNLHQWQDDGSPCQGEAEFILAKHRNGALGSFKLQFIATQACFKNLPPKEFHYLDEAS